jgi:hypothetical protein
MTFAATFVQAMTSPVAWSKSSIHTAWHIDEHADYDKMEPDLGFFYFSDGSRAGVRPQSRQAWEVTP